MENALKDMDLQQKRLYTAPEMKVEVLHARCNLLEDSLPNEIGVIIPDNTLIFSETSSSPVSCPALR